MSSTSLASGAHVHVLEPETTLDDSSSAISDHVRISGGSDRLSALPSSSPQIRAGQGFTMLPSPLLNQNLPLSYSLPAFDIRPLYSRPVALVPDTARDTFRRLSFESERVPISRMIYQGRAAHHRNLRGSDSYMSTPALATQAQDHQHSPRPDSPNTSHAMPSRSSSPFRMIQQWSATHFSLGRSVNEDPFIPINPFRLHSRLRSFYQRHIISSLSISNTNNNNIDRQHHDNDCPSSSIDHCDCDTSCCFCLSIATTKKACSGNCFLRAVRLFILDNLPRQVYLYLLFRLPALYFTRVSRVFRDAEVSRPDIQRLIDTWGSDQSASINVTTTAPNNNEATATATATAAPNRTDTLLLPYPEEWAPPSVSPALARFKLSWEDFIDSLMTEWKALNVVSALLPTAVVTMLQTPEIAHDPATRTVALMSLICSLTSLCYGCVYLVRFGSMRSMHKATRWAEEARQQRTSILWNVWVLLAIPGVWLAWSMVLFIATLLLYVYRLDSIAEELIIINEPDASSNTVGPRVAITVLVCLGILYFVLIISTLKRYGGYASHGSERRRQRMGGTGVGVGVGMGSGAGVGVTNITERVSMVGMYSRDKTAEGNDISPEKQRNQQPQPPIDAEHKEAAPATAVVPQENTPIGLGLHSSAAD